MRRLWTLGISALLLGSLAIGPAAAQEEGEEPEQEVEQPMEEGAAEEAGEGEEMAGQEGWIAPSVVEHEIKDPEKCLACHKTGMMDATVVPDNHQGRPDATCMWCHGPEAEVQTTAPAAMGHELEGKHSCLQCHLPGALGEDEATPVPASHEGRDEEFCTLCHGPETKAE